MAYEEGIIYIVQPCLRGGWQVVSRSSEENPLPENEKQTFRHHSGFMCVFETKEDAIKFCKNL
jgi:hypothetical protein